MKRRLRRLAKTPKFDYVSYDQNVVDLDEKCHDLLVGDWKLVNGTPGKDSVGTLGFLAVDRDIHGDDVDYNIYLVEIFQYNKTDEKGRCACGVLVYELTKQNTVNGLVASLKVDDKISNYAPAINEELEISDKLHVIRLDAVDYATACIKADDWFAAHLPPSKRDARQYPRLTRVAWR